MLKLEDGGYFNTVEDNFEMDKIADNDNVPDDDTDNYTFN